MGASAKIRTVGIGVGRGRVTVAESRRVYERYAELLNVQDLGSSEVVVDRERYRETAWGSRRGGSP